MSLFWSIWIITVTVTCLILIYWVLMANRKVAISDDEDPENRTTGHVYDGIEEYDNPLPRWWFRMFLGTMIFGVIYLILFPGLGSFQGVLGWSSVGKLERDQEKGRAAYAKSYDIYVQTPIEELVDNPKAMKMGARLFANNCSVCHGADAAGNFGFPDLTDNDWLWGGTPDKIRETLVNGRTGNMPAWSALLGEERLAHLTEYVLSVSGQEHNAESAQVGAGLFAQNCASCHGKDAKGLHAMGAPNLTDAIWLYDGSRAGILDTLRKGRMNQMPAQKDLLRDEKIHVLTAYVYSQSLEQ